MAHWYTAKGEPMHKVPTKDGSKMRPTTIRDARKLGLCPSVTEIISLRSAPALTNWKVDQALLSAFTIPRLDGESIDSMMRRAKWEAAQIGIQAAEIGGQIHDDIERVFRGVNTLQHHDIAREVYKSITDYTGIYEGWETEVPFASMEHGFGGRIDLVHQGENIVIDYKSKDITDVTKKMAYPNHCQQLSAYEVGMGMEGARLINVFVDRTEAGKIAIHDWEDIKMFDQFECLLKLWQLEKGYTPFQEEA